MEAAARVETTAEATNYEHESAPTLRAAGATEGV
jgi:hypothetical protein